MSPLIKYLLTTQYKYRYNNQVSGFTMIELLVAAVMSFLIITPILAFAVNILEGDVKEQAKASTELELQSAMDYIQQDISQAFYIYDGAGINTIRSQLYDIPNVTNELPVLVFWKREIVKNAIDSATQGVCASPVDDDEDGDSSTTNLQKCDDGFVESLVAYYLVPGDSANFPQWCQPGSSNCPSRIERWSIKDGIKNASGVYICGTGAVPSGRDTTNCSNEKAVFQRSLGMPYTKTDGTDDGTKFSMGNPTGWIRSSETLDATTQVLVNYVDRNTATGTANFCLNSLGMPTAQPSPAVSPPLPMEDSVVIGGTVASNIPTFQGFSGCVDSARNIARITIRGDALRRNDANSKLCDKESPNCPSVSGQIGGRSGFGQ
jgi:type II secretory pathway pseudopilin PulG